MRWKSSMSKPHFDRVILSCDLNPVYAQFWPFVAKAWQKLFGVEVWLALVTDPYYLPGLTQPIIETMKQHGHVMTLNPAALPMANQAKVARYWLAAYLEDDAVTMINDIDLLPLSKDYVYGILAGRPPNTLLTLGFELYTGPEAGKATAGYLTLESKMWTKLVNPERRTWNAWLQGFVGLRQFDHKENIASTVPNTSPDCFSDESLMRYWISQSDVPVKKSSMPFWPYTVGALDRSDWQFDPEKLKAGVYKEAHMLRPLEQHRAALQPLFDYIGICDG